MRHITIIVDEKAGVLKEIAEILGGSGINIEDINAMVIGNKGMITIGVGKEYYDKAVRLLKALGHKPISTRSIVLKLEDKPGILAMVTDILTSNNISITKISLIDKNNGIAYLLLDTTDNNKARVLLSDYV